MAEIAPLIALDPVRFDQPDILKKLATASRRLAELKGVAASMPNQGILISTLALQEAKDSSAIENIITTHDELFRNAAFLDANVSAATKEVAQYRQALAVGVDAVARHRPADHQAHPGDTGRARAEQRRLSQTARHHTAGSRWQGRLHPLQDVATIVRLMGDLEWFIDQDELYPVDP